MKKSNISRSLLLNLFVLLTSFMSAQDQTGKTPSPDRLKCEGCVSKVFQLPESTKAYESQDIVNLFRTVVELRFVQQNVSQHTVAVEGTHEQVKVAEKLLDVIESLRSGGTNPASIVVYKPEQPIDASVSNGAPPPVDRELTSSYIKALYRPDYSMRQMQALSNALLNSAHIVRFQQLPSSHVIVVRGTLEQVKQADALMNE